MILTDGDTLRLAYAPEDVVIVPDDYVLPVSAHGVQATRPTHAGGVRIIAALVNPAGESERNHETVTLLNTHNSEVDLAGWRIADAMGEQSISGILARGETLRVWLGNSVKLNNTRDTITVVDTQSRLVDQVVYEPKDLPAPGHSVTF